MNIVGITDPMDFGNFFLSFPAEKHRISSAVTATIVLLVHIFIGRTINRIVVIFCMSIDVFPNDFYTFQLSFFFFLFFWATFNDLSVFFFSATIYWIRILLFAECCLVKEEKKKEGKTNKYTSVYQVIGGGDKVIISISWSIVIIAYPVKVSGGRKKWKKRKRWKEEEEEEEDQVVVVIVAEVEVKKKKKWGKENDSKEEVFVWDLFVWYQQWFLNIG